MKGAWETFSGKFNERNIRERIIFTLCALVAVYLLWDLLAFSGVSKQKNLLDARYAMVKQGLTALGMEEQVLSQSIINSPNAKKQREIVQLDARLKEVGQQLADLSVGLISAEKLPSVIRDVLAHRGGVELLGMQALLPERLELVSYDDLNDVTGDSNEVDELEVGIFKHRVVFRVRGKYFDIASYLDALEKTGWNFYWSELEYRVDQYPYAIAQLEAYTMSTELGFIHE